MMVNVAVLLVSLWRVWKPTRAQAPRGSGSGCCDHGPSLLVSLRSMYLNEVRRYGWACRGRPPCSDGLIPSNASHWLSLAVSRDTRAISVHGGITTLPLPSIGKLAGNGLLLCACISFIVAIIKYNSFVCRPALPRRAENTWEMRKV